MKTDGAIERQYFLFLWHNITPMQFYKMGENEKAILYAYVHMEIEQRIQEQERINSLMAK